jgi:hypothetical protein
VKSINIINIISNFIQKCERSHRVQ